jgi:thiol-disulfide isomerase/thioredoxin
VVKTSLTVLFHVKKNTKLFLSFTSGPCKMIAPFFAQLATKYPNAIFSKVDVDQVKEVAAACKVTSM